MGEEGAPLDFFSGEEGAPLDFFSEEEGAHLVFSVEKKVLQDTEWRESDVFW